MVITLYQQDIEIKLFLCIDVLNHKIYPVLVIVFHRDKKKMEQCVYRTIPAKVCCMKSNLTPPPPPPPPL